MKRIPDTPSIFWMSLFPATYAAHILEEWWADFPGHLLRTQGIVLSAFKFEVLQIFGLILMIVGVILSRRLQFPKQMLTILATSVLGNSLAHLKGSYLYGGYEPGLLTSIVMWLPLGTFTLIKLWQQVPITRYLLGVAIGIAICVAVQILAMWKF